MLYELWTKLFSIEYPGFFQKKWISVVERWPLCRGAVSGGSTVTINMPLYRVLHRAKNPQQQQRHHNTVAQCYTEIQTALQGYTQLHKVIINMVTSSFETDTFCLLVIIEQSRAWVGGSLGCAKQPGATVWGVELETRNFFEINLKLYFIFH